MTIPNPNERPDLYENDIPEDRVLSKNYVERMMPEHLRKRRADREAASKQQAAE